MNNYCELSKLNDSSEASHGPNQHLNRTSNCRIYVGAMFHFDKGAVWVTTEHKFKKLSINSFSINSKFHIITTRLQLGKAHLVGTTGGWTSGTTDSWTSGTTGSWTSDTTAGWTTRTSSC